MGKSVEAGHSEPMQFYNENFFKAEPSKKYQHNNKRHIKLLIEKYYSKYRILPLKKKKAESSLMEEGVVRNWGFWDVTTKTKCTKMVETVFCTAKTQHVTDMSKQEEEGVKKCQVQKS